VASESSDVTRFRAFGAAALAFAFTVVVLLAFRGGPSALLSPGPLARPHRELGCAACHETPAERVADACTGCHGPHPSARPAHAALARNGELPCATCHAVHRAESGLAFEADGTATHYGTGFERPLGRSGTGRSPSASKPTFVPLVSGNACARCHDLERETDPAFACFVGTARGAEAVSVCFDEHRRPGERSGARPAARDAAVERARALVPRLASQRLGSVIASGATLALGALLSGLVVVFARQRAKRAKRPRHEPRAPTAPGVRRLPIIDASRCLGCQACVDACPYDVLEMSRYVAVVSRPEQCCGAATCLGACPNASLTLEDGPRAEAQAVGSRLEWLGRPGVFVAGDASGGSLVRSALEQGVSVARTVADELARRGPEPRKRTKTDNPDEAPLDLVVIGAGPAGLAAGLEAERRGLDVLVLEQASIAESIRRFSRDKLVLDAQPAGEETLPLWIGDSKKEELLRRWLREVRVRGLRVREGARVVSVEVLGDGAFRVRAVCPDAGELAFVARRVVVATGRRGSPRKLDASVPETAQSRVHYELSDARAFAGTRAVVVGLGDVAMETAIALALQPGTTVTMLHRGSGFSRGRLRNVETVGRLVAEGRIGLLFGATIRSIEAERLVVEIETSTRNVLYDALFVHIGAEAPASIPITESASARAPLRRS
jgi:thioredoxin reductase/NAD-dependent dihydropyrimidine dehydrogenase PreA subunit